MKQRLLVLLLLLTLTLGCAKTVTAPVPGSVNQFDSDTYLTLLTSKAVIDQTKASLAAGSFPTNISGAVKTAVNGAVTAYNLADTAYQALHTSLLNGTSTPAQQATVTNAVTNLNTAVAGVTAAKAGQ